MNKIIINIIGIFLLFTVLSSCEDKLEEKYQNPEQTSEASMGKFLTKMENNRRVRAEYWNMRTFVVLHPALYTQTVSFLNGTKRYQQQVSYTEQYWSDFYTPSGSGIVAHYREIEKAYNALTDEEKASQEIFLQAAKVIFYDQASQMVDLWGDIPFSDAGVLNLTGSVSSVKFDDAATIYSTILDGLKDASNFFASSTIDPVAKATFNKQDIMLNGDIDMWRRYVNSLRLRLLMRISFSDETTAKTAVMEMLNNPSQYPLVDESDYDVLLWPLTTYKDDLRNAFTEVSAHLAPQALLDDVLKPANDPRIPVMYDKYGHTEDGTFIQNADYFSMSVDISSAAQEDSISKGKYAIIDSATFIFNNQLPGVIMTAAEVSFLKAEALERWGSSADAMAAYEKGVEQSVDFYYYLNSTSSSAGREDIATPGATEIEAFLSEPMISYTGTSDEKLAKIWTQKWVHFGFMQSVQAWSEKRRTKYPQLTFVPDTNTPDAQTPPSRLLYPTNEKTYNPTNYSKVADKDTPDTKIFWDAK